MTIQDLNGEKYLEIGYLFKKKHWHKGYAVEAALGCKNYIYENKLFKYSGEITNE